MLHRIVQLHRGTIAVDDREGGGTRFTVRLPDVPVRAGALARQSPSPATHHLEIHA